MLERLTPVPHTATGLAAGYATGPGSICRGRAAGVGTEYEIHQIGFVLVVNGYGGPAVWGVGEFDSIERARQAVVDQVKREVAAEDPEMTEEAVDDLGCDAYGELVTTDPRTTP